MNISPYNIIIILKQSLKIYSIPTISLSIIIVAIFYTIAIIVYKYIVVSIPTSVYVVM
jgi:hypothetical protein